MRVNTHFTEKGIDKSPDGWYNIYIKSKEDTTMTNKINTMMDAYINENLMGAWEDLTAEEQLLWIDKAVEVIAEELDLTNDEVRDYIE